MARGWKIIAREAARTACTVASFGLVAYLGMNTIIKIEATRTRLFLVAAVFGVAFGAAYLSDHLAPGRDGETLRERLRGQPAFGFLWASSRIFA